MGYSIYYNRAFIRVGDQYVPLVCSGASNGADYVGGRWVPEKDWSVLNWKRRDRVLFSGAEIREIAKDYERHSQENGMSYRSRYKPFAPGEFERWIISGMSRASTIEEYRSVGNVIQVVDYPNGMAERWRRQPFTNDEELRSLISQFSAGQEFDISFNDREVIRPPARKMQDRGHGAADGKPSVLGRIAEARKERRNAKAENRDKPPPVRKKSNDPEL
jgi:hypothetical protein